MEQPAEPYRIAGNLYSVGTNELSAFLIATPEGHILINSNYEESVRYSARLSRS